MWNAESARGDYQDTLKAARKGIWGAYSDQYDNSKDYYDWLTGSIMATIT